MRVSLCRCMCSFHAFSVGHSWRAPFAGPVVLKKGGKKKEKKNKKFVALSLHVFVSRLFGWALLEKKKKREKRKREEKIVKISQSSSEFVTVRQNFVKVRQDFVKILQKILQKIVFKTMNSKSCKKSKKNDELLQKI